jgi:hypothetical protein
MKDTVEPNASLIAQAWPWDSRKPSNRIPPGSSAEKSLALLNFPARDSHHAICARFTLPANH